MWALVGGFSTKNNSCEDIKAAAGSSNPTMKRVASNASMLTTAAT